jgi:hypothetical protein
MMRSLFFIFLFLSTIRLSAQVKPVKISEPVDNGEMQAGPSVAINFKKPENIIVGLGYGKVLVSHDGGKSWIPRKQQPPVGKATGNPVVVSDVKGGFHSFYLAHVAGNNKRDSTWQDRVVCQSSIDYGKTWLPAVAVSDVGSSNQAAPYAFVHPEHGVIFLTWTEFDHYGSPDSVCKSNLEFSISTSEGRKWGDPIQINQQSGGCEEGMEHSMLYGATAIDLLGKLYMFWSTQDNIMFDRSYDASKTWLSNDIVIGKKIKGSLTEVPGIRHCIGIPAVAVDWSWSFARESLYVVWTGGGTGALDADIFFAKSLNRGDTWTPAARVNQDVSNTHQFLPSMVVDAATGIIYIVYYDRRGHDDQQTDIYMNYSLDHGKTFREMKITETSFSSGSTPFYAHTGIAANKGNIMLVWSQPENSGVSIWSAALHQSDFIKKEEAPHIQTVKRRY